MFGGHFIVCGLGRIGRELVNDRLKERKAVLVIERNPDNRDIERVRRAGAVVIIGDATDEELLKAAHPENACDIFFVTGADERNLEGATDVLRLLKDRSADPWWRGELRQFRAGLAKNGDDARPTTTALPRVLVQLTDGDLDSVLQLPEYKTAAGETIAVRSFNALDRTFRKLIEEHVHVLRARDEADVMHFVIFGFGDVAERLALWIAGLAHFENRKRSRMTILFDPSEAARVAMFAETYQSFFPPANTSDNAWKPRPERNGWDFGVDVTSKKHPTPEDTGVAFVVNGGFACFPGEATSDACLENLVDLSTVDHVIPLVFVCRESDEVNCAQAIALREALDSRLKKESPPPPYRRSYARPEYAVTVFAHILGRPTLTQQLIDTHKKKSSSHSATAARRARSATSPPNCSARSRWR